MRLFQPLNWLSVWVLVIRPLEGGWNLGQLAAAHVRVLHVGVLQVRVVHLETQVACRLLFAHVALHFFHQFRTCLLYFDLLLRLFVIDAGRPVLILLELGRSETSVLNSGLRVSQNLLF